MSGVLSIMLLLLGTVFEVLSGFMQVIMPGRLGKFAFQLDF